MKPLQDLYPDDFAHCYGCGRLNAEGLHIKSEWHGGEAVARFRPAPQHIALPGFVYGGLIASLIDCHAMATAAAASMEKAGAAPGVDPTPRFVTASLQVDYLRPTPLGPEIELRSRATEIGERKVIVEVVLRAGDSECARGRVVAVRMPAGMAQPAKGTESGLARGARLALVVASIALAHPSLAQKTSAPPPPAMSSAARDDIVAFAKLSISVAQVRDSIQKELAEPRNKTPQAQQQLREQLASGVEEVLHHAGMSEEEFRHKTYVVSTDSASRSVFDETIAKMTGAPLPGQLGAAPLAVAVPAGPVGVHIGHVMNGFTDTPKGLGLLPTAMEEARIAAVHAGLAARDLENLGAMKLHAGHVINAVDPTVVTAGPGLGYGVKRSALGIATHMDLAAKTPGASAEVVMHANHVATSARNTVQRADAIVALAKRIQAATAASDASALVSQLVSLTNELMLGKDADADGKVTWKEGEGGLQQCDEHVRLMLTGNR